MEFSRRIGAGRLAEVFGESALDSDQFIRTAGWRRVAEAEGAQADDESRALLQAYADGINAHITTHRGRLGLGSSPSLDGGRSAGPFPQPTPERPICPLVPETGQTSFIWVAALLILMDLVSLAIGIAARQRGQSPAL